MATNEATTALHRASRLSDEARTAGRWYARYLVLYAIACFALAATMGWFGSAAGAIVISLLSAAFIVVLSVWAQSHPAVIRGMTTVHLAVVLSSMTLWLVTVVLGTRFFTDQLGWWVAAGLAMAVPPLIGAAIVSRRTAV